MVDISRDPRWGRVVEGAGEDPYLGSAIAAAKVRGYQGSDFSVADKMAAKSMVLLNNQNHASSARPSRACARWSTA